MRFTQKSVYEKCKQQNSVYRQVYKRVYAITVEKLTVTYVSKLCKPKTYIKVINIDYRRIYAYKFYKSYNTDLYTRIEDYTVYGLQEVQNA